MRGKIGLAALLLSAFFWAPGMQVVHHAADSSRLDALADTPVEPASVTVPAPAAPVVVANAAAANNRGWYGSAVAPSPEDLTDDVLAAYTLAVAISPPDCHITTPILAAIGQVESGNLAGKTLDASHRVVPSILGPVLDGQKYLAVADTDAGTWDGNTTWDRALGPMQIIPASWRVVGMDMDGDGVRDPQNIYDSAGAAMVYLCSGGHDLATDQGLRQAVLSYNKSPAYLDAVLTWKKVFDNADLSGSVPFVASLAVPMTSTPLSPSTPVVAPGKAAPTTTAADRPVTPKFALTPHVAGASPSVPASPSTSPATSPAPSPGPSTPATTPGDGTTTPATPATPDPTPAAPEPTQPSAPNPTPPTEPSTTPTPDPTPLPECPVPTDVPTDPNAPTAEPDPGAPVVSPQTCTPPEGYAFDPETLELVLVTPAP